jgi:hypothetical protein
MQASLVIVLDAEDVYLPKDISTRVRNAWQVAVFACSDRPRRIDGRER